VHYSAPSIVGRVEAMIAKDARLFVGAGFPTRIVAGRKLGAHESEVVETIAIPEMDSENPAYLELKTGLDAEQISAQLFSALKVLPSAWGIASRFRGGRETAST
jgi:hypothetical protein